MSHRFEKYLVWSLICVYVPLTVATFLMEMCTWDSSFAFYSVFSPAVSCHFSIAWWCFRDRYLMLSSVMSALHDGVSETGISCCHLSCQHCMMVFQRQVSHAVICHISIAWWCFRDGYLMLSSVMSAFHDGVSETNMPSVWWWASPLTARWWPWSTRNPTTRTTLRSICLSSKDN